MDFNERRLIRVVFLLVTIAVVFLLLSGTVSAAWWNPVSWVMWGMELMGGIVKAIVNLVNMITKLTGEGIMEYIAGIVKFVIEKFFDLMKYLLTLNPTVYCGPTAGSGCTPNSMVTALVPTIMSIIQPFYVMMVFFTGLYYIFAAIDPRKRAAAKNMLMKLLVGMVIVALSMPILQFTLDLSSALTGTVFSQAYGQFAGQSSKSIAVFAVIVVGAMVINPGLLIVSLLITLYILIAVLLVMAVRYIAVVIFSILFPAALFLYFFDSTKNLGATLVYQTVTWVFIPVVQALMIVITFFALEGMVTGGAVMVTDPDTMESSMSSFSFLTVVLMLFMVFGGIAGVIIAPLIMMQIMKWVGGAIAGYGMMKIPQAQTKQDLWKAAGLTALGGATMGGLARGLPFTAAEAAYMSRWSPGFGDAASWRDVMPTLGDLKGWAGGGGGGGQPWTGASKRARESRIARGEPKRTGPGLYLERKGLISDFFGTYHDALTYDKRKAGDMMREYGPGGDAAKTSGRGMPLSPATSLAGSGKGEMGEYTKLGEDSYGARSKYMGTLEGPPFLSIPLYFLGGAWGASISRAGTHFRKGEVFQGVGVSLFETFKVFSPFRPIRHLGRILYTAIPEIVPPIPFPVPFVGWNLRDVAYWGSRKMTGIGFGQMAGRASWAANLGAAESDYNSARKRYEKSGGTDAQSKEEMDKAAKKYAKILDEIREGFGIRKMSDRDYYEKKLKEIFDHNKELHSGVMQHMRVGMEGRDDVLDSVERVRKAKGDRKSKVLKSDMDRLLFEYTQKHHGGNVDAFASSPERGIGDFMKYNAAMQFGVGVNWKCDEQAAGMGEEAWSRKGFNLKEMERYIEKHEATGASLVVEENGKYRRSRYRLLEGAAYGCATQNEMIQFQGRSITNIHIIDATSKTGELRRLEEELDGETDPKKRGELQKRIKTVEERGRTYSFVDVDGSNYVERMRNYYETGGGTQLIHGTGDERTEQGLDARGVGFKEHFTYRQVHEGNFMVHYRGKPVADLTEQEIGEVYKATGKHPGKLTRDDVLLTSDEAVRALGAGSTEVKDLNKWEQSVADARKDLGRSGLSERERDRLQKELADARTERENARKKAYEAVRKKAVADDSTDMEKDIKKRYLKSDGKTPIYANLGEYKEDLAKANRAIYFSGAMVSHLRNKGYSDRDIDQLKIALYNNPRYNQLIERGENVDIRIDNNPNNREVAWVNTDKAGRRTLNINVGCKTYAGKQNKLCEHLIQGDILGHETTHDRMRERYGDASHTEIWRDFTQSGSRMEQVFDANSLNNVRRKMEGVLGVSDLNNRREVKKALKREGLTEEDMGQMLSEGLADVGGSLRPDSKGDVRPDVKQQAYNDSMSTFVHTGAGAIGRLADAEWKANIKPGGFASDLTGDDISALARMKSLSTQTSDYVDDGTTRRRMGDKVDDAAGKLTAGRLTDNYDTRVAVYQAIHGNAVILPLPTPTTGTGPTPPPKPRRPTPRPPATGAPTGPTPGAGPAPAAAEAPPGPAPTAGAKPRRPTPTGPSTGPSRPTPPPAPPSPAGTGPTAKPTEPPAGIELTPRQQAALKQINRRLGEENVPRAEREQLMRAKAKIMRGIMFDNMESSAGVYINSGFSAEKKGEANIQHDDRPGSRGYAVVTVAGSKRGTTQTYVQGEGAVTDFRVGDDTFRYAYGRQLRDSGDDREGVVKVGFEGEGGETDEFIEMLPVSKNNGKEEVKANEVLEGGNDERLFAVSYTSPSIDSTTARGAQTTYSVLLPESQAKALWNEMFPGEGESRGPDVLLDFLNQKILTREKGTSPIAEDIYLNRPRDRSNVLAIRKDSIDPHERIDGRFIGYTPDTSKDRIHPMRGKKS